MGRTNTARSNKTEKIDALLKIDLLQKVETGSSCQNRRVINWAIGMNLEKDAWWTTSFLCSMSRQRVRSEGQHDAIKWVQWWWEGLCLQLLVTTDARQFVLVSEVRALLLRHVLAVFEIYLSEWGGFNMALGLTEQREGDRTRLLIVASPMSSPGLVCSWMCFACYAQRSGAVTCHEHRQCPTLFLMRSNHDLVWYCW